MLQKATAKKWAICVLVSPKRIHRCRTVEIRRTTTSGDHCTASPSGAPGRSGLVQWRCGIGCPRNQSVHVKHGHRVLMKSLIPTVVRTICHQGVCQLAADVVVVGEGVVAVIVGASNQSAARLHHRQRHHHHHHRTLIFIKRIIVETTANAINQTWPMSCTPTASCQTRRSARTPKGHQ